MDKLIWCIIYQMLELSKRCWHVFFPLFAVFLLGSLQSLLWLNGKWYQNLVSISLASLALVSLVIAIIAFVYDIKDAYRKDKERKRDADRKALRESVKRLNPEYTEKQIDTWMNGK